jgi:ankyrin repeat protein
MIMWNTPMTFWKHAFVREEPPKPAITEMKPSERPRLQSPVIRSMPSNCRDLRGGLVCALIFEAARDGALEPVKAMFDGNPTLVLTRESYPGATPLHVAAEKGKVKIVELLLAKGLDPNSRNKCGSTPLHVAANKREVAELLIAHGADVNARNNYGATPLHRAAAKGSADVVELLLGNGSDVNARDNDGTSPLHYAARESYIGRFWVHKKAVECLLGSNADINARDNERQTPLHMAVARGLSDMVKLLLLNNADVNAGAFGRTPLSYAELNGGFKDIQEMLRQHGGHLHATETDDG